MQKIVIIGSNSIHCKRYIAGIANSKLFKISIITNHKMPEFPGLRQRCVNFALHNLRASKLIRNEFLEYQPDIVHIHQANSYAWHSLRAIAKLKHKPKVILTAWGSDVLLLPQKSRFLARMVRYNLAHADIITADSLYMSTVITKLLGKISKPIYTINFGIQYLPQMQDINHKEKLILSNRLHRSLYQIDKIIKAFANLIQQDLIDQDHKLVVAADGEENQNLRDLVFDLGIAERVEFTGMLDYDKLVTFYQRAAVFVSVPFSDGTASSLLEAMSYGCIPVLSNLPANLEWVLDKVNGFIAPNVNELQQQILAALELSKNHDEYQELYSFNYSLIKNKAAFSRNIQDFIRLYNDV